MQQLLNQLNVERKGTSPHVVLEGFHAIKHAKRFGADISDIYIREGAAFSSLGETVRDEDIINYIEKQGKTLSVKDFDLIAPKSSRTGVVARAVRTQFSLDELSEKTGHVIVLENPRDLDNVGAVVRVCAARGVAGLIITGDTSPWHARAIRAGAGLQWAIPIIQANIEDVLTIKNREIIACTDEGESMYDLGIPSTSILIFGTEREGITQEVRQKAKKRVAIPMQEGVSSLNLATSVAALAFSR